MSYVMYIRHRMSISDIRHCRIYVEMNTYDVVCVTYDVVCRRTTSYVTYDVARTMSYVYTLYIALTTSYVRCSTRCRTSHVRCRTYMTYDIVRDVRHRRWQESRCSAQSVTGAGPPCPHPQTSPLPSWPLSHSASAPIGGKILESAQALAPAPGSDLPLSPAYRLDSECQ